MKGARPTGGAEGVTPLKVIFIAGSGRNGSTLLGRLLGEVPGVCHVGEASTAVFTRQIRQLGIPCGCGERLERCPHWREAVAHSGRALEAGTRLLRWRNVARAVLVPSWRPRDAGWEVLRGAVASLLRDVARRQDAEVVVENSKIPLLIPLLREAPGIEPWVVHLVRDARADFASRTRAKDYLDRTAPPMAVALWCLANLGAERLGRPTGRYRRVRYEDFVRRPRQHLAGLLGDVLGRPPELGFLDGSRARVGVQHALAGNPDKFEIGEIEVAARPWRLRPAEHLGVSAVTAPLLVRYGYPVGRARSPGPTPEPALPA